MTMAEQPLVTGPQVAGAPAPDVFAGPVGRAFRQMLLSDEIIGQVLSEVGPDGLRLTGGGGFLPQSWADASYDHQIECASLRWPHLELFRRSDLAPPSTI